MMSRDRRSPAGRRGSNLKARLGIATAVVVGGGAIGAVVATTSHHGTPTAQSAGYSHSSHYYSPYGNQANDLYAGLSDFSWSHVRSFSYFSHLYNTRRETDMWRGRTQFAFERGTVVLATRNFVVIRAANGQFNVWFLSRFTHVTNVASSMTGTTALTGSSWAASQAMSGSMTPLATTMAGSTMAAQQAMAPSTSTTVTVNVAGANVTVTVKVTNNMATVRQNHYWWHQSAWTSFKGLRRGQVVFIAGTRSYHRLQARVVLVEQNPMTTTTPAPTPSVTSGGTNTGSVGSTGTSTSGGFNGGRHT